MHLIDAHAHLSFFSPDQLQAVFKNADLNNIKEWILAGYDSPDWEKQLQLFKNSQQTKKCFGLHPWRVHEMTLEQIDLEMVKLAELLPQAQGCGETGLDSFRATLPKDIEKQREVFVRHLELNRTHQLPLILHIVKSHEIGLSVLKNYQFQGIVHGFSGSWETAKNYIKLGYKISIGRGLYSKGFKHLKETAQKISLEDFVIESDAFVDDDGTVEDPVDILLKVVEALSQIKGVSPEKIGLANYENVKRLFG